MIKVLVVDDSSVARALLAHILQCDPDIHVVGAVPDGARALEFVREHRPDAVLMDIHMPHMDGFEATRRIMETVPVPIVVCSGVANATEVATAFRAMEAGALACVGKPVGPEHQDFERLASNLRQTVRLMSEVRVVRRWARASGGPRPLPVPRPAERPQTPGAIKVIGIGASTGGPQVLQEILMNLPKGFAVPILVVQHIAHGFLGGLTEWLHQTTGLQVHVGAYGASPQPGHVYLAPDDFHMALASSGRIVLTREKLENHLRPAVSYLFRSLATVHGAEAIGVLLTGMGTDGAAELKLMKDSGAVTIAQDASTCVVYGMPGEAVRLGAATHVLPADKIAAQILRTVAHRDRIQDRA